MITTTTTISIAVAVVVALVVCIVERHDLPSPRTITVDHLATQVPKEKEGKRESCWHDTTVS
jgi:hypothetical protein